MSRKQPRRAEFGDFQTPENLAREICAQLLKRGLRPRSLVEPTCGTGAFLSEALETFPKLQRVYGFDVNANYIQTAAEKIAAHRNSVELSTRSFFDVD